MRRLMITSMDDRPCLSVAGYAEPVCSCAGAVLRIAGAGRRVFTVPTGANTRKFLRIHA